jgi:hypothetical protein
MTRIMAVGVIQTFDEHNVYYYDGINMISKLFDRSKEMEYLPVSVIQSEFSADDIEILKTANHWGITLKPENYFTTSIEKVKPSPIKSVVLSDIYHVVSPVLSYSRMFILF